MSSPTAAPSGSPQVNASAPAESTTPPPASSSTPPPVETPAPPPPAPISASPPAPPPDSASPPTSTSTSPPPVSPSPSPSPPPPSPPPPAAATQSPPPPSQSPPPPKQSSSSPAQSPSSAAQSPPPPVLSSTPPASVSSPPPPSSSSTLSPPPPPTSTSSPSTPSSTSNSTVSPPPPPTSTSSPTTPSTLTTPSPSAPPSSSSTSISTTTLTAIIIAGILAASVILILVYCFCKKKKKKVIYFSGDHQHGLPAHYQAGSFYDPHGKQLGWHSPQSQSSDVLLNMPPPPPPFMMHQDLASPKGNSGASQGMAHSKSWFTYAELASATNGFSSTNMLGEGGFGCVYKGVLANGQVVAVKQLKTGASQGEKEFQAEVEIISRVHHRHLVSLVGYCIADSQRLLVYDYVPNNTLEYHLHKRKGGPVMDWATRIRVASGAARGLAYLHEDCHPRIIHRDIKSANILLDNSFEAQVSDFGLAKLTADTNTHVTTRVMGTFGYLAPEYASSGKLTEKSDVFSFGVVLLELLTGRKPVDISQPPGDESLVEWARPILAQVESEEDLEMLVDPSLNGAYDSKEALRMAEAAAACVRHSAHKRPRMGQVVRALEDEASLSDLAKDLKPGHSSMYGSSFSSTDYENGSYSADMRKFRMVLNENNDSGVSNTLASSGEYQTSREMDREARRPMRVPRPTASANNEFWSSREL